MSKAKFVRRNCIDKSQGKWSVLSLEVFRHVELHLTLCNILSDRSLDAPPNVKQWNDVREKGMKIASLQFTYVSTNLIARDFMVDIGCLDTKNRHVAPFRDIFANVFD